MSDDIRHHYVTHRTIQQHEQGVFLNVHVDRREMPLILVLENTDVLVVMMLCRNEGWMSEEINLPRNGVHACTYERQLLV